MKYLIWGTGNKAEELYTVNSKLLTIENGIEIVGFIDNNHSKKLFHGINVYAPDEICKLEYDYIDIWVIDGYEQIRKQILEDLGISVNRISNVFEKFKTRIFNEYNQDKKGYVKPTLELISICTDYYRCQQWYKYAYGEFENRKHAYLLYKWICKNVNKKVKILEVACGVGGMLYHLREDGFLNLSGYDIDNHSIQAAKDINYMSCGDINFFVDNAKKPQIGEIYDVIVWVSGMYILSDFSLDNFFEEHLKILSKNGYIMFDMVDSKYNEVPQNQYGTKCWDKEEKLPSEYIIRMSENEVVSVAKKYSLKLLEVYDITGRVPMKAYVFSRI